MRVVLYVIGVVIILLQTSLALRLFNDEYPGVTVCESSMTDEYEFFMPYSYMILKKYFAGNHNCTHIEGNVIIHNVWPDPEEPDMSFLSSVIEVSGMISLKNNSLPNVIFPNLRVIRGQQSTDTEHGPVSLYLKLINETTSGHAIFPNLTVISKHSVYFESEVPQTFLPRSIDWTEVFENPEEQKLFVDHETTDNFLCHPSCTSAETVNLPNKCWSENANHCQKQTKCRKAKEHCRWCYFKKDDNKIEENCCDHECSGGCSGIKGYQCTVCKTYTQGDTCVGSCSPEFINVHQEKQKNPDFRLRVGTICAKNCPLNLLQEKDACIYLCTSPQFYRVGNKCLPCRTPSDCNRKECHLKRFHVNDTFSFFITKDILYQLTDCEHIVGELHFTDKSFDKTIGGVTVPMLYENLRKVQFLTGDFMINGSHVTLHNLTFLENLQEIRHLETLYATASLNIMSTDIEFLGLRHLRHIYGSFEEIENPNLCYLNTIQWEKSILTYNQFDSKIKHCNKSCDPQCTDLGCWGPTSDMCYQCKGVRAGSNCVDKCTDEPGFYFDTTITERNQFEYDDGSCKKCNYDCAQNCTGPLAEDCVGGCRHLSQNGKCVRKCSTEYYQDGEICYKCNSNCYYTKEEPLCTGNGSYVGQGGCSLCLRFIETDINSYHCFNNTCPVGFYLTTMESSIIRHNYPFSLIYVCKPCTKPCSICSGASLNSPDCKICDGYWNGEICGSECFPAAKNLSLNQSCPYCTFKCQDGCTASVDTFQCSSCNLKRLNLNDSKHIQCTSRCPPSHNYTHLDIRLNEALCLNSSTWNNNNDNSRHPFVLIIIVVIFLATVCILILQYFYKVHHRKSINYLKDIYSNIKEPDSSVLLFNTTSIPNMNRLLLIPTTNLIFNINDKPLGTGAFGAVYHGLWKPGNDSPGKKDNLSLDVAIKVIQTNKNIDINEILEEAKVMASVSHKHCLRLIGICVKYEVPCLVTTFVELGSLDKYLRKHKYTLSSYQILSWGEQIANGMAYLEMRGIIHRDLATRNVLVNNSHVVQITDFGLARILQNSDKNEQVVITSGQVPIRWLALETLTDGIFSHKTDVWAYGVTLWEIFTFGLRPYNRLDVREITVSLQQGYRLSKPEICSKELYVTMNECWLESANLRPSFQNLMTLLLNYSRNPTFYLNIPNDPCLTDQKWNKQRQMSQCSYEMQQYPKYKGTYKQQSMDGTISTFIGDYSDDIFETSLKRNSSTFSNQSNKRRYSGDTEKTNSQVRQHSILSENLEEYDNFLESGPLLKSDSEYLEPIKK